MKLIMITDLKGVGKKGEVINANDGYAKNFLIPKKYAVEATNSNKNELDLKNKAEAKRKKEELEAAQALGKTIEETSVTIPVKTGSNGKLFGAVTNKEISEALELQQGIKIDKKKIELKDQIKMIGTRHVTIKLHPSVSAELEVKIIEG